MVTDGLKRSQSRPFFVENLTGAIHFDIVRPNRDRLLHHSRVDNSALVLLPIQTSLIEGIIGEVPVFASQKSFGVVLDKPVKGGLERLCKFHGSTMQPNGADQPQTRHGSRRSGKRDGLATASALFDVE